MPQQKIGGISELKGKAQHGSHFEKRKKITLDGESDEDYNAGTQQISKKFTAPVDWKDPDVLAHFTEIAPGWYESENLEGRKFYYSLENNTTQWKHPFSGEITLPPERKRIMKKTVFGEFTVKNNLAKPFPGQTPHNDPNISAEESLGTKPDGTVQINTAPIFISQNEEDQIGRLNNHMYTLEQKVLHKEIVIPYSPPIDDRPRRLPSLSSKIGHALFYVQYVSGFMIIFGGFTLAYRWRCEYYGYSARTYPVNADDREYTLPEYKWLFGVK